MRNLPKKLTVILMIILLSRISFAAGKIDSEDRKRIMHAYLYEVDKNDGITKKEAIILAQSQLFFLGNDKDYKWQKPIATFKNQQYQITFNPITPTMKDVLKKPLLIVTVTQQTGQVKWQKQYPQNQ